MKHYYSATFILISWWYLYSKRYRYVILYIYDCFKFRIHVKVCIYLNIECEWTFFIALLFVWMFFIILHFLIARLTYFWFSLDVIEDMILNYTSAYFTHSSRKKSINNYWRNHDMMKHFFETRNILLFVVKEKIVGKEETSLYFVLCSENVSW